MKKVIFYILWNILFLSTTFCQIYRISWYSLNSGYGEPKAINSKIKSVIGQTFAGVAQESNTGVSCGFLADTLFRGEIVHVRNEDQFAVHYFLWQNYPNPFNPSTTIRFEIPNESDILLELYDMLGREVRTLVNEVLKEGIYEVMLHGYPLSSGVYFYCLRSGGFVSTKKLIFMK